jgi:hypothetical protein
MTGGPHLAATSGAERTARASWAVCGAGLWPAVVSELSKGVEGAPTDLRSWAAEAKLATPRGCELPRERK